MCAISGFITLNGGSIDVTLINRMLASVIHRGPDDRGVYIGDGIALGHRRLSIIDLSTGHQPMTNPDRTLWITFNGEIFNYRELRSDLVKGGHTFTTTSDTEVILHLYEERGESCVIELNGQWAFALWDSSKRRLFLSRDRIGVRPLYYTVVDGIFLFSSEVKSLFAVPTVPREIDHVSLHQLMTLVTPIAPRTVFKSIFEVPPGHSLIVENGSFTSRRYWQMTFPHLSETPIANPDDEGRYAEELLTLLTDATRLRLRSDVPVGAYLSGGIDSSLIAALISRSTGIRLTTFSVAFEDSLFDETSHQTVMVTALSTDHRSIHCSHGDIASVFPDVIWHAEKPILYTAPAPLYLLSRLVRDSSVKVVLTGEGSDELFGGYDIFRQTKARRFCANRPESRFRQGIIRRSHPQLADLLMSPTDCISDLLQFNRRQATDVFFSHLPRWTLYGTLGKYYSRSLLASLDDYSLRDDLLSSLPAGFADWHWLSRAQYLELHQVLSGYLLSSQGDRMTMAHSIEGRFPFLDYRVVEFASRLPPTLKLRGLCEKYILKKASEPLLPAAIVRRRKQPYAAPGAKSFFQISSGDRPLDYVSDLLSPTAIERTGLFEPVRVRRLVERAKRGTLAGAADDMALVAILSTQLVVDQFIEKFRHD